MTEYLITYKDKLGYKYSKVVTVKKLKEILNDGRDNVIEIIQELKD